MFGHDLVSQWQKIGFASDSPNSALVLREAGVAHTFLVETTRPRYEQGVLQFTIKPISGSVKSIPLQAELADFFIDDAALMFCDKRHGWEFPLIHSGNGECNYIAKKHLSDMVTDSNSVYCIPASQLVSNYLPNH